MERDAKLGITEGINPLHKTDIHGWSYHMKHDDHCHAIKKHIQSLNMST